MKNLKQKMVAENPFYGKSELLTLANQIHKLESDKVDRNSLNRFLGSAWNSCKTEDDKAMFWVIVFSSGDIANRDHNLFRRMKVASEGGGNSARNVFYWASVWALTNSTETEKAWYSFLDLIPEYTNWENLFYNGIRTDRRKGTVIEERFLPVKIKLIAKYLAKVISNPKTPDVTHQLLSKFLDKPRTGARQKKVVVNEKNIKSLQKKNPDSDLIIGQVLNFKRELQKSTVKVMQFKSELATELSNELNWEMIAYPKNVRFVGLENYKAKWNRTTEAYLFSSKEILNYDEVQFVAWLDMLSSGARYRVQCRILDKDGSNLKPNGRWKTDNGDLGQWFLNWMKSKEVAQATVRNLSEDQKKEIPLAKLKELEKAAKVNVGATTMIDIIADFFKGNSSSDINIRAQAILDKIDIQVPVLVITDVSGSMNSASVQAKGVNITALKMAQLATTMFLLKNPNEDLSSFFIRFDNTAEVVVDGVIGVERENRFMSGQRVQVAQLIDKKKDFLTNFTNVSKQIFARGGTEFNSVSKELKRWVEADPQFKAQRIETVNQYPVWLVISDGDMNNSYSAAASMAQFKMDMKQWFGWEGIVVVWDVKSQEGGVNKFENVDNVVYYGGFNPSILHQIFCNLHDLDVIDVYTPLVSLFRSQRYAPIRDRVLGLPTKTNLNESDGEVKKISKSKKDITL